jgi:RNA polymerase sigma-70 factor (sigma-E family)
MTTQPMPSAGSAGSAGGRGADAGFAAVYAAHYDPMIRLAGLTTGDLAAAEDIVQDAFVALYRRWPDVDEPAAWLRRVVANRSTSWLRRRMVARRHAGRHPAGPEVAPPPAAEDGAVRAALARLSARQRAAVFLRFYLDLSEAEIAVTLACRPGTVKSLLHRALRVLREVLDAD